MTKKQLIRGNDIEQELSHCEENRMRLANIEKKKELSKEDITFIIGLSAILISQKKDALHDEFKNL